MLQRPRYTQIDPSDRPCRRRWVGLPAPPPSRSRGHAAAASHVVGHPTSLYLPPSPPPIFPLMPHYLVLCTYAVRSGYAYPSALLWVDPLINKVGPCQKSLSVLVTVSRLLLPMSPRPAARSAPLQLESFLTRKPKVASELVQSDRLWYTVGSTATSAVEI